MKPTSRKALIGVLSRAEKLMRLEAQPKAEGFSVINDDGKRRWDIECTFAEIRWMKLLSCCAQIEEIAKRIPKELPE